MGKCSKQGCRRNSHALGLCDTHYRRKRRRDGYRPPTRSWSDTRVQNWFWSKAQPVESGCWQWNGGQNSKGYGVFMLEGSAKLAHRVAWEACEGEIPDEMTIDHLCFNKLCVNPLHMEVVTRSENSRRGNGSPAMRAYEARQKAGA